MHPIQEDRRYHKGYRQEQIDQSLLERKRFALKITRSIFRQEIFKLTIFPTSNGRNAFMCDMLSTKTNTVKSMVKMQMNMMILSLGNWGNARKPLPPPPPPLILPTAVARTDKQATEVT